MNTKVGYEKLRAVNVIGYQTHYKVLNCCDYLYFLES